MAGAARGPPPLGDNRYRLRRVNRLMQGGLHRRARAAAGQDLRLQRAPPAHQALYPIWSNTRAMGAWIVVGRRRVLQLSPNGDSAWHLLVRRYPEDMHTASEASRSDGR